MDPWASRPYPSAKQMIPAPPNIAFTFVNFRAAGGLEVFRRIFLAIFHKLARGSLMLPGGATLINSGTTQRRSFSFFLVIPRSSAAAASSPEHRARTDWT